MRHRHLDYLEDTPAAEFGAAAVDDLLDRGDLDDWTPLLREIRRDPTGPLAERVLRVSAGSPRYGTSRLFHSWVDRQRNAARPHTGDALRRLRHARGLTQQRVAERLGATQPEISKLEKRDDARLSTLRAYVAALGGSLELVARFDDGDVSLLERS